MSQSAASLCLPSTLHCLIGAAMVLMLTCWLDSHPLDSEMVCLLFAASSFLGFCCQCFQLKFTNIEPLTPLLKGCHPWQHGANSSPPRPPPAAAPRVSTSWKDPQAPCPDNSPSWQMLYLGNLPYVNVNIAHHLHCYVGWLLVPRAYPSHSTGIIFCRSLWFKKFFLMVS